KPPFGGPEAVLAYLSRYTHRIAIANSRLLAFDGERVTFKWKDYRAKRDAPLQAYDARCRRVHPPLPDPCAARRIPPHPALRPLRLLPLPAVRPPPLAHRHRPRSADSDRQRRLRPAKPGASNTRPPGRSHPGRPKPAPRWSLNRRPVRNRQIRSSSGGKFPIDRHQRPCELPPRFPPSRLFGRLPPCIPSRSDWQASENP